MTAGCSIIPIIRGATAPTVYEPIPAEAFHPVERPEIAHPTPEKGSVAAVPPEVDTGGGGGNSIRGRASWFATGPDGLYAAAGPAVRHGNWRGSKVRVCADDCVVVTLNDWCQCYRNEPAERVIDLSDEAFSRLAPLSRGVINVTVEEL